MEKVTVIIPSFKPGDYVWACLDSLAAQTMDYKLFEIVMVLNGPKEPYFSKLEEWGNKHLMLNFSLIYSERPNVSAARNLGIDNARGEYITFVDDDDYVSANYLAGLSTTASLSNVSIAHPVGFFSDGSSKKDYPLEKEYFKIYKKGDKMPFLKGRRFLAGPCMKLIHRKIIGDIRFDETFKNGEDSIFMYSISRNIQTVSFCNEDIIYYRQYRNESANFSMSTIPRINNSIRLISKYFGIWKSDINKYSLSFLIFKILGSMKTIIVG